MANTCSNMTVNWYSEVYSLNGWHLDVTATVPNTLMEKTWTWKNKEQHDNLNQFLMSEKLPSAVVSDISNGDDYTRIPGFHTLLVKTEVWLKDVLPKIQFHTMSRINDLASQLKKEEAKKKSEKEERFINMYS